MLNLSIFAERLSELMLENNLNSPKLAEKLGCHRTTITRYLTAKKIPSLSHVIKLADYFECSADFILGLEDEYYNKKFTSRPPFDIRFKFLLEENDNTKSDLVKQTGIPESLVYNWLNGDYTPTVDNVIKLAKYFNCTVDFVLGRGN